MWYVTLTETNTNYEKWSARSRAVNKRLGYPNWNTRTTRIASRKIKAADPSSIIEIPDSIWASVQADFTGPEVSGASQTRPASYVDNVVETIYNVEFNWSVRRAVVTDGDSIISTANAPWNLALADRVYTHLGTQLSGIPGTSVKNVGLGGKTLASLVTDAPSKTYPINFPASAEKILVIWAGTNDINGGANAATTFTSLTSYINGAKAVVPDIRIIVCTPIARLNSTVCANLSAYRDLIINPTNIATLGYEVADTGGHPDYDVNNPSVLSVRTRYQSDTEHPDAAGTPILASVIASRILA